MRHNIFILLLAPLVLLAMIQMQPLGNVLNKIKTQWQNYLLRLPADKVYLRNDKPLYRPGETIWFSAFVRNADFTASQQSDMLYVELINPKGNVEKSAKLVQQNGLATGSFELEKGIAGGLYKLRAYTWWQKNEANPAIFEKDIQIQEVVLPRLKLKLDFVKESYEAGEELTCLFTAESNENQPLAKQKLAFSLQIAGETGEKQALETDEKGEAAIRFPLPKDLKTADVLLNVNTEYQGQTEAISRAVPVKLEGVRLEFFPEGGDAVAGLPCRVAFRALDEKGKPADAKAYLADSKGNKVLDFQTETKGMGVFTFTPKMNEKYIVCVPIKDKASDKAFSAKNVGARTTFLFPKIKNQGFSLQITENSPTKIKLSIASTLETEVNLLATMQEKEFFAKTYRVTKGQNFIEIPTQDLPMGLAQITLFDKKGMPQAERLCLVNAHKKLNVKISTEKEKYLPREKVTANLEVTDEKGKPVKARFALSVVNDQLLSFADDKSSDIFSWLLVESEIKDKVHEPHFYFDEKENPEKRAKTLDYLLMTAAWRRFTWEDIVAKPKPILYDMEKTEIRGTVIGHSTSKGQEGAKIEVEGMKGDFYTNKNGEFHIKGVPVPTVLKASFEGKEATVYVDYANPYHQYLYLREPKITVNKQVTVKSPTIINLNLGGNGKISGRVVDDKGKPAAGAEVRLLLGEDIINGAITDAAGDYAIQPIEAGTYDIEVLYLEFWQTITNVPINSNMTRFLDIDLGIATRIEMGKPQNAPTKVAEKTLVANADALPIKTVVNDVPQVEPIAEDLDMKVVANDRELQTKQVVITAFKNPPFEKDPSAQGTILNHEQIKNKATRNINAVAAITPGVYQQDEGDFALSFRGAREGGTVYFVDGVKVRGTPNIPQAAISRMEVYTGGTPAEFGDFTGGVINITTTSSAMPYYGYYGGSSYRSSKPEIIKPSKPNYRFMARKEFAAPIYGENETTTERTDFRSTIFWDGDVETDAAGKASVSFYTSDEISSFRIIAEGISDAGMLGMGEAVFFTQLPFSLSTKLPVELVVEDRFILPITLVNHTDQNLSGLLNINTTAALQATDTLKPFVSIAPHQAATFYKTYTVISTGSTNSPNEIQVKFAAAGLEDAIKQPIRILYKGFPANVTLSGQTKEQTYTFEIGNPVNGSLTADFKAYPDMLEQVLSGIEGMLQEPHGCFEQTSSSTYPNILVLNYLQETGQIKPEIQKRALELIEKGYKRLTSFESKGGGFEWFGGNPAHEGLTAYGVLEFTDMKKVWHGVDEEMLKRTQEWLLARRDGNGGFLKNPRALHQFGMAEQEVTNAYIVWALSENKMAGLEKEIENCYEKALSTQNPYQMALVANVMFNYGKTEEAKNLLEKLSHFSEKEENWIHTASYRSAPGSQGISLSVETKALIMMAMLKSFDKNWTILNQLAGEIAKSRNSFGMYGSTNSTVLALRALTMFAKESKTTAEDGTIELYANDKKIGEVNYQKGVKGTIQISDLQSFFPKGKHHVTVKYIGTKNALPYTFSVNYYTFLPVSDENCKINLQTNFAKNAFKIGETARLKVILSNKKDEGQAMTIAKIGIPAGLILQPWQLKEMQEKGVFDFYETQGNTLILYYRQMKPLEMREINLDLRVELAGDYNSPASCAYLYYTNEFKTWTSAEMIQIVP